MTERVGCKPRISEVLRGNDSRQLTHDERAIAAASALDSVRAEGLNPCGIEDGLSRWVRGELTIAEVVQRELQEAKRIYGPPTAVRPARRL